MPGPGLVDFPADSKQLGQFFAWLLDACPELSNEFVKNYTDGLLKKIAENAIAENAIASENMRKLAQYWALDLIAGGSAKHLQTKNFSEDIYLLAKQEAPKLSKAIIPKMRVQATLAAELKPLLGDFTDDECIFRDIACVLSVLQENALLAAMTALAKLGAAYAFEYLKCLFMCLPEYCVSHETLSVEKKINITVACALIFPLFCKQFQAEQVFSTEVSSSYINIVFRMALINLLNIVTANQIESNPAMCSTISNMIEKTSIDLIGSEEEKKEHAKVCIGLQDLLQPSSSTSYSMVRLYSP